MKEQLCWKEQCISIFSDKAALLQTNWGLLDKQVKNHCMDTTILASHAGDQHPKHMLLNRKVDLFSRESVTHAKTFHLKARFVSKAVCVAWLEKVHSFSNINLIFLLFHLAVPPASHFFSTWQNLNLSADGALYCFLWLHRRGRLRLTADVSCFDPFSGPSPLQPNTLWHKIYWPKQHISTICL